MRANTKHLYQKMCKFDFVAWAFPTTLKSNKINKWERNTNIDTKQYNTVR